MAFSNFNVSDDATAGVVKDDDRTAAGHLKALFLLTARAGTGFAKLFVGNRQRRSEGLRISAFSVCSRCVHPRSR
jgi:hypothetical protein